jgi:Branched-chain amino acid transport protein (AzlD)
MNHDLLIVALLAGAANWAFRVLPTKLPLADARPGGLLARFLAATGPAAIATLFVASILPWLAPVPTDILPLFLGTGAVLAIFFARRSVVGATLAGSLTYGLAIWALA